MIDFESHLCYLQFRKRETVRKGEVAVLAETRRQLILNELRKERSISAQELAALLGASISTVRRDLIALEEKGLLNKVYGGAALNEEQLSAVEMDMLTKEGLKLQEKQVIGRAAAAMIRADDFVFIDAGSTTLQLVHALDGEALKAVYVTNGLSHTRTLTQKGCEVYVPAGRVRQRTEAIVGATALVSLRHYNFTKAFLGVNGVSLDRGFMTPDVDERELKAEIVRLSGESWFLADDSKFDKAFPAGICPLHSAGILTNRLPNESYRNRTNIKEAEP